MKATLNSDPIAVVRNACALIREEDDRWGLRWMLYEIASHAGLCQAALEEAGLQVPGYEERVSYRKVVDASGKLVDRAERLGIEPEAVPFGLDAP